MRLYDLELMNFKGCRKLGVAFDGQDMNAYGANESGKTTLYDAFLWLMFGKDCLGRADFEIKPLDASGQPEHGLEHSVSATFDMDGSKLALRKVLAEKWTKKRGSADREFTGHTVSYFVDDVPKSERDYKALIASICDENVFRLLTNPRYFSEQMKWQERRRLLLDVCGDITDADVIASATELAGLPDILGKRSLEDHKKVLAAERKRINDELESIPIRISEQERSVSDTKNLDPKSIRSRIAHLTLDKQTEQSTLNDIRNGGEIAAKTKALSEIESKILDVENKDRKALQNAEDERRKEQHKLYDRLFAANTALDRAKREREWVKNQIANLTDTLESLRKEWMSEDAKVFSYQAADVCPTCGQDLPAEQVEAARKKALADFNEAKARLLSEITAAGKARRTELGEMALSLERSTTEIANLEKQQAEFNQSIEALKNQPIPAAPENPELAKLREGKAILESALSELRLGTHDEESNHTARIAEIDAEIAEQNRLLASIDVTEKARKRIEELKRQELHLAAEFERLEGELHLTEVFTRRKVEMLDEKINSRFRIARFKLFNQQINGGLEDCCEITIKGVPYWSANNAARTQAGLDVCNVLADHYSFHPPLWIDNRESVTEIPEMSCQVISLIVSPADKELRFETVNTERKAA